MDNHLVCSFPTCDNYQFSIFLDHVEYSHPTQNKPHIIPFYEIQGVSFEGSFLHQSKLKILLQDGSQYKVSFKSKEDTKHACNILKQQVNVNYNDFFYN